MARARAERGTAEAVPHDGGASVAPAPPAVRRAEPTFAMLRGFLQRSATLLVVVDADLRITWLSEDPRRYPAVRVGVSFRDLMTPDEVATVAAICRAADAAPDGEANGEVDLTLVGPLAAAVRAIVLDGGELGGRWLLAFTNISHVRAEERERRERDVRLAATEQHLLHALGRMPTLVVSLDRDLRYTYVSHDPGYVEGGFLGRTIREAFPPTTADVLEPLARRALAGERIEVEVDIPSGRYDVVTYVITLVPDRGPDGAIRGVIGASTDVTSIRASERAALRSREEMGRLASERSDQLERARSLYRDAITLWPDPFVLLRPVSDPAGRTVDFVFEDLNPAALATIGGFRGAAPGRTMSEVFPEDFANGLFDDARAISDEGGSHTREYHLVIPEGEFWLETRRAAIGDGVVAQTWRITNDTREAAERLRESEERFRGAFDSLLDTLSILQAVRDGSGAIVDFEVLYANRAWREVYTDGADPVGRGLYELVPELVAYRPTHLGVVADRVAARAVGPTRGRLREYQFVPFRDGFVASTRDVTEQVEAERELRAAEERYRHLVDELDAVVTIIDAERNTAFVSGQAATVLGHAPEELRRSNAWREGVVAEDRERVFGVWDNDDGLDAYELAYRFRRPDGRTIWLEERMRAERDADGGALRWYGVAFDVTDRRRLEEDLARTERLRAVARLAAAAAHDFGNVLLGLRITHRQLARDVPPGDPREAQLERMREALERGGALVRQLLAFGRERATSEPGPLALAPLLAELEPTLALAAGREVVLTLDAPSGLAVSMPRGDLEQALLNLVLNARDAMPAGGRITVAVRPRAIAADAGPLAAGAYVAIRVTDTGTGMSPEVAERAFEPFFTTKPEGAGIGLSGVYGSVREAGGLARIESATGRGTTVELLLPAASGTPPSAGTARVRARRSRGAV